MRPRNKPLADRTQECDTYFYVGVGTTIICVGVGRGTAAAAAAGSSRTATNYIFDRNDGRVDANGTDQTMRRCCWLAPYLGLEIPVRDEIQV